MFNNFFNSKQKELKEPEIFASLVVLNDADKIVNFIATKSEYLNHTIKFEGFYYLKLDSSIGSRNIIKENYKKIINETDKSYYRYIRVPYNKIICIEYLWYKKK